MFYADDPKLYITIDLLDQRPALDTLQKCICEVIEWNTNNKLVCNSSKAEVVQFSSRFVKNPIKSDFSIGSANVQPSDRDCNLGVSKQNKQTTKFISLKRFKLQFRPTRR